MILTSNRSLCGQKTNALVSNDLCLINISFRIDLLSQNLILGSKKKLEPTFLKALNKLGSGGGSVGRAVTSDTRDPQFRIPTLAQFILSFVHIKEKTKIKKERPGMAHIKKRGIT